MKRAKKLGRGRWAMIVAGAVLLGAAGGGPPLASPVASVVSLVQRAQTDLPLHPGRAILEYQRARLLAPRAPAVREGLARARTAAGLPADSSRLRAGVLGWLSPDEWSRAALAALALAGLAATAAAWRVRRRWTVPAGAVALAVALGAGTVAWWTAPGWADAVVVAPETVARVAPFAAAEPAFIAPEGSSITIQGAHDGYVRIRHERGSGWVASSAVEPVLPRS